MPEVIVVGGGILFGNSDLDTVEIADPDAYSNRADNHCLASTAEKLAHRFPGLADGAVASSYAVGRLVADLVVDGVSSDPMVPESDFRLSRFAEGQKLTSPHPYSGAGQLR